MQVEEVFGEDDVQMWRCWVGMEQFTNWGKQHNFRDWPQIHHPGDVNKPLVDLELDAD
jgi:hypothetical protein